MRPGVAESLIAPPEAGSKPLTKSLKLAISIPIPFIVIAAMVVAIFFWRRGKARAAGMENLKNEPWPIHFKGKPELQAEECRHEMPADGVWMELPSDNRRELGAQENPFELAVE